LKYRDFIKVIVAAGFKEIRCSGDHHQYEGTVDNERKMVTAAFKHTGEDIRRDNLSSMIRQSGLPKKLFR